MSRSFLSLLATLLLTMLQSNVEAGETVQVLMQTSAGDITLELYPDAAPVTVANFLKYVDAKRYDNNANFYRTVRMDNQAQNNIKIEVIQGGLGMEDSSLSFTPIAHESSKDSGILHTNGAISMARLDPGSAASEFFICINDQPALDFGGQRNPDGLGFAAFGKVIAGMDVVKLIQAMNTDMPEQQALEYTSGQILTEPVLINKVKRLSSQQIDRDTWDVISQSVKNADIEAMASTYHPDAILVSSGETRPISDALEGWGNGMQEAKENGKNARVAFRFSSRQDDKHSAFEQGVFKYTSIDASGKEEYMYMHFESLLVKQNGRWLYLMERQLEVTNEAAWNALNYPGSE